MLKSRIFVLSLALAAFLAACGTPASRQTLHVSDGWARPGLGDGNSAVYFVVDNRNASNDTLLSASCDIAGSVEMHMTMMHEGNMEMLPQKEIAIPSGKTVFEPGGLHVMLIGLAQELKPGDTFTVKLNFATAGEIPLEVTVREP